MTWIVWERERRKGRARAAAALGAAVLGLVLTPAGARADFQLGLQDAGATGQGTGAQARTASAALHAIDGSVVRVLVPWAVVAPGGERPPAGFRPSDPGDPRYRWSAVDLAVRSAEQHHLRVILFFAGAPAWAQGPGPVKPYVSPGAWDPNPRDFAAFMHAAAVRYGGSFRDPLTSRGTLPRVRYWEPWNEPNIPGYFSAPHPVNAYRTLLNRAYGVLKAVHRDNVVILGGLAPVSPVPGSIPPLDFGADLLCLHRVRAGFGADRACPQRTDFDVFAVHPYSLAATPTKHASKRGDALVGDMGAVRALVRAANRFHTALPQTGHKLWVTEFAWPTNPPDHQLGDSDPVAARYVAYSIYEMWRSGVSLVIWLGALDEPGRGLPGGGLYWSSGRPKLTLRAYAFPVVASVRNGRGSMWGRVPVSHRVRVLVQRAVGHGWRSVAMLRTGSDGVFSARFRAGSNGFYRAHVIGGQTSLTYNSRPIPPKRIHLYTTQ